jgi:lactate permease
VAAVGGSMAGLVVSVAWIRWQSRLAQPHPSSVDSAPATSNPDDDGAHDIPSIQLALAGYLILVVLALALRGIGPVKDFLGQWALAIDIPATTTDRDWTVARAADVGFGIPAHPGVIILYSCLIAYVLYLRRGFYPPHAARDIAQQSGRRAVRTGIGVFMMVSIAATMERAGMTEILAQGLADAVPADLYALVAPVIGALGAFVTGSNTNSNAVFGMLQRNTAEMLGLSLATILGAQTSAAAVASVLSPAKVAVGCSTVDANEGVVLRWLLGYGAILVGLVALMTWAAVKII